MSANRYIGRAIYDLKRQYGVPIRICRRQSETIDFQTGNKTVEYDSIEILRAVKLPSIDKRTADYAQQSKEWAYGGHFEVGDSRFLIDQADLPVNWYIKKDDYLIFDGKRFDVVEAQLHDERQAWLVDAREIKGAPTFQLVQPVGILIAVAQLGAEANV